jgi:hypothetical protein
MLQIISGKFFKTEEVFKTPSKAVIYSNYFWNQSIETCVGTLEPIDTYSEIKTYIFHYTNQIEKDSHQKGFQLVKVGDPVIVQQFMLICSFGLQAIFSTDRDEVEKLCRRNSKHLTERYQPSDFLQRFFETKINGIQTDVGVFIEIIKRIIGLKRDTYKAVINGLYNLFNSFSNLTTNIESSYSSLVYCLESFSQSFDGFLPEWEDYNQNIRQNLEGIFEEINVDAANEIKAILLENANLRLQKRFVEFVKHNVSNDYFVEEAYEIKSPLKKSELRQVLLNAYDLRSKFVHELKPLLKHLTLPDINKGEVFTWEHNVYITYNGLTRLTLHVIKNFIYDQEYLEKEEYDWRSDLPGSIDFYLSPEYWIGIKENFTPKRYLEGLIRLIVNSLHTGELKIPNMDSVLELIEETINTTKKKNKHPMLVFYLIFNDFLLKENKRNKYEKILSVNKDLLKECSIENMVLSLFNDEYWIWEAENCEEIFKKYQKKKYMLKNISLPLTVEVSIIISIANLFFNANKIERYKELLNDCLYELSGNQEKQDYLKEAIKIPREIDINFLFETKQSQNL